jgi:hypothetical protein
LGATCNTYREINVYNVWLKSLKVRYYSEDLGVDGRIILKRILNLVGAC